MDHDFAQVTWDEQLEDDCRQIVRLAVREDLDRYCDWSTVCLVPPESVAEARFTTRQAGVISGLPVVEIAVDEMQADVEVRLLRSDGDRVTAGETIATIAGSARDMLTTERILLNFLGRQSGIASLTAEYVKRVGHTKSRIYDTRKTTPGWRRLEKYAVRTGGGNNHRVGLFAGIMIKDNHLAHSRDQGVTPSRAVAQARSFLARAAAGAEPLQNLIVEVEVDTVSQCKEVLRAGPDIVLLDNMTREALRECVDYRDQTAPDIELEASGGVQLSTVAAIAETGVDRISVGAITHSAVNFDIGLDWS